MHRVAFLVFGYGFFDRNGNKLRAHTSISVSDFVDRLDKSEKVVTKKIEWMDTFLTGIGDSLFLRLRGMLSDCDCHGIDLFPWDSVSLFQNVQDQVWVVG